MIDQLNPHVFASQVRMMTRSKSDVFIISEDVHHSELFDLFERPYLKVIPAYHQRNVLIALDILISQGYYNIFACIEGDVDKSEYAKFSSRILCASGYFNSNVRSKLLEILRSSKGSGLSNSTDDLGVEANNDLFSDIASEKINVSGQIKEDISDADWNDKTFDEINTGIDDAIYFGNPALAVEIARSGLERFPDNERFARIIRLLAPPKVKVVSEGPKYNMESSRLWLRQNAQHYKGQWVAVSEGNLLAHASTVKELESKIDPNIDRQSIIMTKVL